MHLSQVSFGLLFRTELPLLCLSSKQLASFPRSFPDDVYICRLPHTRVPGQTERKTCPPRDLMSHFNPQCLRRMRMCDKRMTRIMDPGLVHLKQGRAASLFFLS